MRTYRKRPDEISFLITSFLETGNFSLLGAAPLAIRRRSEREISDGFSGGCKVFIQTFFVCFIIFNIFKQHLYDKHLQKSCPVSVMRCIAITCSKICNKIILGFRPQKCPENGVFLPKRRHKGP